MICFKHPKYTYYGETREYDDEYINYLLLFQCQSRIVFLLQFVLIPFEWSFSRRW